MNDPQRVLAEGIARYERARFHLISRTETTARLVKPKRFNWGEFLLMLPLYLIEYYFQGDRAVDLSVDERGKLHVKKGHATREEVASLVAAPVRVVNSDPSPAEQVRQLAELRAGGLVTEEEYETKRKQLLGL